MSFMKRDWHKCYLCNRFGLLDIYLCLLKLDLFRLATGWGISWPQAGGITSD